ncbi:hypothetical protein RJ641_018350 [Dillenia turbinata]|uniref:C3H1-type domain-containing protein n=1 Tax=Dillenia turbinata TaxID=194707 RepID=A0AAN8UR93_9MAGN
MNTIKFILRGYSKMFEVRQNDVISIVKSRSQDIFHEKPQVGSLSDCHVLRDSNGNFKLLVLPNEQIPGRKDGTYSTDQGPKHSKSNKHHSQALLCKSSFVDKENMMPQSTTNKEVSTEFQVKDGFSVQSKGYLTGTKMLDMQSERGLKRRIQRSPAARTSSSNLSPRVDSSKQQKICVARCILHDTGRSFKGSSCMYFHVKDPENIRNRQPVEDSAASNLETNYPFDEGSRDNSEISKLSNYFESRTSSNASNSSFSSNYSSERNMPKKDRGSQRSHQFNREQGHSDLQNGDPCFPIRDIRLDDHNKRCPFGSYGYYAAPIVKDISPICQKSLCHGHKLFSSGSGKLSRSFRSERNFFCNVTNVGELDTKQNPYLFNDQASMVVRSSPTRTSPCYIPACAGTSLSFSSSFPNANHNLQEILHHNGGYHSTRSVSSMQSSLSNPASESEASLGNYSTKQSIMPCHQGTAESSAHERNYKNIISEERRLFDPSYIDRDPRHQTDLMRHQREVKLASTKYLARNADSMDDKDTHNEPQPLDQFQSALIVLVKEFLRPAWCEGKLGRDVYKSILRKSVDKVIGTLLPHQVPSTAVSIQQYIHTFRPKILKLVEEYIELYTKSGAACG